jgi:adenosylcobinamide-GDP ribazoletransferase
MRQRALQAIAAFGLLTRLPVWRLTDAAPAEFVRSVWAFPIVGAVIGGLGGVFYALAIRIGLASSLASLLAVGCMILLTGALHEDGMADTIDGFGGGRTAERRLEIMRDSRIGSYGALALIVAVGLRVAAIATLADPWRVLIALVVAGSLARGAILVVLLTAKPARNNGMAAGLARVPMGETIAGLAMPLVLGAILLPFPRVLFLALIAALIAWVIARAATSRIGGHTGDVLGATAVISECAALLVLTL